MPSHYITAVDSDGFLVESMIAPQYVGQAPDFTGISFAIDTLGELTPVPASDVSYTPSIWTESGSQTITLHYEGYEAPNVYDNTLTANVQSPSYHGDGTIAGTIVAMHSALTDAYSTLGTKGGVIPSSKTLNALPAAIQTLYSTTTPDQSKAITIVENGTTTVTPDNGYVMSTVNVTTSVPIVDVTEYRKIIDRTVTSFSNSTITTIGTYAFNYCSNLSTISFPNCTSIGSYAFNYCSNLTSANFPKCTFIGSGAFNRCSSLTAADFSNCTSIGASAFYYCTNLSTISFPNCTSIGSYAFSYCLNLTSANFPKCTSIGNSAFINCRKLTAANFSVCTSIGSFTFWSCYSLTTVSFPVCSYIGSYAFCSCQNLTSVNFPSCSTIEGSAFAGCSKLTTANFPACKNIKSAAFWYCYSLATVSFPVCSTIGASAFYSCSSLSSAYFPSCSYIGYNAFRSCFSLATLNFPVCSYISSAAFESCSALTSVTGFPVCSTIGSWAFCGCVNLVSVEFPLCTRLYPSAFNFCASLTTLSFPVCTSIGSWAFQNDYGLLSANFPACTFIDTYAFYNCSSFSELHINTSNCVLSHSSAFFGTIIANRNSATAAIYVPSDYVTAYKTKTNWAYYSVLIKAYTPPASGYSVTFPTFSVTPPSPYPVYVYVDDDTQGEEISTFKTRVSGQTLTISSIRISWYMFNNLTFDMVQYVHLTTDGNPARDMDTQSVNLAMMQWVENPTTATITFNENTLISSFNAT